MTTPRPAHWPTYRQYRTIAVCQRCGRAATMGHALDDEWLVARYRIDPSLWVIRCYGCISEWALRVSEAGRTVEWRDRMARGKERAAEDPEWFNPMSTPLPLTELPEELAGTSLPDDSEIDYGPWVDLRNMATEEQRHGRHD